MNDETRFALLKLGLDQLDAEQIDRLIAWEGEMLLTGAIWEDGVG